MKKYRVSMVAHTTFTAYIEAASPEEALEAAREYEGVEVSCCHQCAEDIDGITVGNPVGIKSVYELLPFEEDDFNRFQREYGDN